MKKLILLYLQELKRMSSKYRRHISKIITRDAAKEDGE